MLNEVFDGKVIAVTGGLGSIGSKIVYRLLQFNPKQILVLDNRETELFYCGDRSTKKIETMFCDVRSKDLILPIFKNVDIVIHAAAMKHVPICERFPVDAVVTNIIGTKNIIEACIENNIEKMVLISTDKAVNPTSVMGATKFIAEKIVASTCTSGKKMETKFGVVRFGNVLGSRGSVLEIWRNQLVKGEKITITDPSMTRFVMTIQEATNLILSAIQYVENGETFIFKMPSVEIGLLGEAFLGLMGYPSDHFKIKNSRPGEKLHERLLSQLEINYCLEDERFLIKMPKKIEKTDLNKWKKMGFKKAKAIDYQSNYSDYLLDKNSITKLIEKVFNENPKNS
ncbi:MAG: polysaccharide biosynthesis protein [Candidatus Thermoplasmatota archaeon]|nr:polysaccharide biosynthesis protein [Candidatus Thermoplasmatota archaeon]